MASQSGLAQRAPKPSVSPAPREPPRQTGSEGSQGHTAQMSLRRNKRKRRKELMGAKAGRGRVRGNHLTSRPPPNFGTSALTGTSWSWPRTRAPSVGIQEGASRVS